MQFEIMNKENEISIVRNKINVINDFSQNQQMKLGIIVRRFNSVMKSRKKSIGAVSNTGSDQSKNRLNSNISIDEERKVVSLENIKENNAARKIQRFIKRRKLAKKQQEINKNQHIESVKNEPENTKAEIIEPQIKKIEYENNKIEPENNKIDIVIQKQENNAQNEPSENEEIKKTKINKKPKKEIAELDIQVGESLGYEFDKEKINESEL